jgi:hypothetical protein
VKLVPESYVLFVYCYSWEIMNNIAATKPIKATTSAMSKPSKPRRSAFRRKYSKPPIAAVADTIIPKTLARSAAVVSYLSSAIASNSALGCN